MIHKTYSKYEVQKTTSTTAKLQPSITTAVGSNTAILQQIIKTTVVLCSRLFDTASCIETQSFCPATRHDGGYFSSSLQQHMGDIFFVSRSRPMGLNALGYQSHVQQRRHLAYGHEAKIK